MEIYIKDKLRQRRVLLNLSREQLSKLSGVSTQLIYRAEKDGNIYMSSYFKMHDVLENYSRITGYTPPQRATFDTFDDGII